MSTKIAINGFGRIGKLTFRTIFGDPEYDVVAINDLSNPKDLAHLLKYDSSQGRYEGHEVSATEDSIIVDGKKIRIYAEKDARNLPWKELDVDVVLECTGFYVSKEKSQAHIDAGAKKVVISAPAKGDLKTIVYNVNDNILDGSEQIISGASCTTNCLAPVVKALDDAFGVQKGYMTTVHAYTNDQATQDGPHSKGIESRRGNAASANIVPASTGAAEAVGKVLPHLNGKLSGTSLRVPTITGSIVDLTVKLNKNVTVEEVNNAFKAATNESFGYTEEPIVSSNIIGIKYGSLVDGLSTAIFEVDGEQWVKVFSWYDNEMSYVSQLARLCKKVATMK